MSISCEELIRLRRAQREEKARLQQQQQQTGLTPPRTGPRPRNAGRIGVGAQRGCAESSHNIGGSRVTRTTASRVNDEPSRALPPWLQDTSAVAEASATSVDPTPAKSNSSGRVVTTTAPVPPSGARPPMPPSGRRYGGAGAETIPADLEPKVMAPRDFVRGELPRDELLRRKRQRYAQYPDLEQLLAERGVPSRQDAAEPGRYHTLLPLEAFDDWSMDEFTAEDWLARLPRRGEESDAAGTRKATDGVVGLRCRYYAGVQRNAAGARRHDAGWLLGHVTAWDGQTNRLTVVPATKASQAGKEGTSKAASAAAATALSVPRIYVCLAAEDPVRFADRYAAAYERRRAAERVLRTEHIVEAIPADDAESMDEHVLSRIRALALSTPMLVEGEGNLDYPAVMAEIRADYSHVMNFDLLREQTRNGGFAHLLGGVPLVLDPPARVAPRYAIDPSLRPRVERIRHAFRAASFLASDPRIAFLLRRLRAASGKLLSRQIFLLDADLQEQRPLTLLQFDDAQTAAVRESVQYVRDNWCASVFDEVKEVLATCGARDEVHLLYFDEDGYRGTKTQRFLTNLNREMQDALRHVLLSNVEALTRFIERAGNFEVTVRGINDVVTCEGPHGPPSTPFGFDARVTEHFLRRPQFTPEPLFTVALLDDGNRKGGRTTTLSSTTAAAAGEGDEEGAASDGVTQKASDEAAAKTGSDEATTMTATTAVAMTAAAEKGGYIYYSATRTDMRTTLFSVITRCLAGHGEMRSVERRLFDFLYDPGNAFIETVTSEHPSVQACFARLDVVLGRAAAVMQDYVRTLEPYHDLVALDLADYMTEFNTNFPKTKGVEEEVRRHFRLQEEILANIPAEVNLGLVRVDCAELRRRLSTKCAQVASLVLDEMARRAVELEEMIDKKFTALHDTLMLPTETPEQVVATRDFIKTVPEQVYDLQVAIQETREIHDVLERFQRSLSEEEFNKKWRAIGWPSQLDDEINQRLQELEETKRSLVASKLRSQALFEKEIEAMQQVVQSYHQYTNYSRQAEIAADVRATLDKIARMREQANLFNLHETLFELEKTDYSAVHQLSADFEPYASLWLTVDDWTRAEAEWHAAAFVEIDADAMEQRVKDDLRTITKCVRSTRLSPELVRIAERTRDAIDAFKPLVPTVKSLRTEGMKPRHWDQLSKEIAQDVHPGTTLKLLGDVTALHLDEHSRTLTRIAEVAAREYQIETSLAKMRAEWDEIRLSVKPHKETGCYILAKDVVDTTQETLDDQMLTTQALSFSPFKKIFEDEIAAWEAALKMVQGVLDEWLACQKSWLYLEPIFQSEDIARQLPSEHKRFQQVNKTFKMLTSKAHEVDLTMRYCKTTERCVELLKENNNLLELVERGLNQYLENKRASFARFYFLSDDELLSILSEARDPQKIQPHFRKLFENIARIDMRAPEHEMFGMYSHMDEYIPFLKSVLPRKYVENWLTEIEHMMKLSIRAQLEKGVREFATMDRKEFVLRSAGQVAIAVNQIMWTAECENSLRQHGSLAPYVSQAKDNLMTLVEVVRQPLSHLQRMNLSGLITIEVHARDIVDKLAAEQVDSVWAFEWVSQLRSYWENNDCVLRQVEAQFRYGGEYLGNTTRLVITPLTDRIYLTLTGAMHMFLGGAPAGPAGTGKTETVKDLAKAVAKQCVVFNCQEGMTYASMGKFFKGLAQAGAWACFDEFNRIDVEVLSVVAQQVSSLQEAARTRQYRIPFEGTEILVDPSYSVFITMNPGYAGRTELPDNLKVLFRPVACMVPDYAMIAEIRLFSFGYSDSRKLAQKMAATFRLSSEQLSSQDHYDFGMRAVNTVISAAGLMKREHPDEHEDVLLLRALRDSNAPKFFEEDLLLFNGIISDLFPGVTLPTLDYGDFLRVLQEQAVAMQLQPTDMFIKKCVQLYEMSVLRHGQMTVGPTMGGKTSATRVLQAAMTRLRTELKLERFAAVKTYALNPKSITMSQLYGGFDDVTGEWRDGLVGELFRVAARDTSDTRQWIVFDGPVDALWIESMNTVLDDNKKLCLISGEIITMTPYMNCWFEVEDLAVASPATVSRAGMIYMEPDTCIGVTALVRSWQMYRLPSTMEPYKETLQELCERLLPALVHFVQTQVVEYNPSVWPNLVVSCFNLFACLLRPYTPTRTTDVPQDKLEQLREVYMHLFVFAIVWSFGATGDTVSRLHFDKFLREQLRLLNVDLDLPLIGSLQDYEFIAEERRWVAWTDRLPPFSVQVTQSNMADLIVPTADVARYKYVHRLLLENAFHTLCCGPTGTGKTVLLQQLLMHEMPKEFTPIFFTFSARTSANQTQDLIFSKFEVRRRASPQIWGAPLNRKFVVFVDDMNMPMKEQYGAQPPIEILRQYMDYHGWYDRRTREFFQIVDVIYAGAMGPPGGGRNSVSNRFLRHFNQIAFPEVDDESMKRIYLTLLENYFAPFAEEVRGKVFLLVTASIEVFNTVTKELRPTPMHPHYLFNLRDLSKVMGGVVNATVKTVRTTKALLRLWLHEERRTFGDRLTNEQDRAWFGELLRAQVQKHFRLSYEDDIVPEEGHKAGAEGGKSAAHELLFADFLDRRSDQRVYAEVPDEATLVHCLEAQLDEYNQQAAGHKLELVMFSDAVQHVCRIARVLRKPGGHVLLLGVGGSGRQSLSRLAAHINEYAVSQVEITKGYSTSAWHEDLKAILRRVAFHHGQELFLFTDTQIVHESMLEDVNNLLNSGEVPNLFLGQEFDDVLNSMKPICVQESVPLDKVSIYARFVRACRTNLHISLCMSPLGETFRGRLRMFPALVNCCTIDWFSAWPGQALRSVAHSYFRSAVAAGALQQQHQQQQSAMTMTTTTTASSNALPLPLSLTEAEIVVCTEVCVRMHESVEAMSARFLAETRRHNYVTPTSFLELLHTFRTLVTSQTQASYVSRSRLVNGLAKLKETEDAVAGLQQTLAQSQPVLLEKSESIKALVHEMQVQTTSAEVTKKEAQREREAVAQMQAECAAIEQEAQEQLAEALPELDRALESLKNLKSSQITEVAGYKAPTAGVVMTMQGICILFQIKPLLRAATAMEEKKPDYWATAKEQLLNNPNLLMQRLINYDKEHIPERLIQAVMPLVSSEDFTPKKIAGASQACAAMCQWTHAMVRFHAVNKKVEPLRQRLAVAQAANRQAQEKLQEAEQRLAEVARVLAELQARKESADAEMRELEETVKVTELKLERAAMLIHGLADEKKSWSRSVEELEANGKYLLGNMLAAAGQIAYCGPFTALYRKELLQSWRAELTARQLPHSEQLSVYHTLRDAVQIREWTVNGLPTDALSVENALILTHARRWPLMIDPQTQANKWIRQTYKDALEVLKPSQRDLVKRIEYCIRAGRPVLLENVGESLDASLAPLLARQTFMQGGTEMIRISDTAIPWNAKFKFFMTTKWPNPHYIPEVMVRVTLLNFFITPQGLEEQLLGVVVGQERKELETRRSDLIQKNAAMRADLADIQKTILRKLEEVKGDILDDVELIEYLNESKKTTAEITTRVAEAEEAEVEIDASREVFRPIARHASCLYFCSATLANVDPMYQYSLQWFVQLFLVGIDQAARADDLQERLDNLRTYFTFSFYQNISRSLFEKHKLMFSFYLCVRILQQAGGIDEGEFRFLLQGPSLMPHAEDGNPDDSWLTAVTWNELNYLDATFAAFRGLCAHITAHCDFYRDMFMSASAHRQPMHGEWAHKLSAMQRMMFLRCLRPDKLMEAVQDFVAQNMGDRFIRPPPFDLLTSYKDSTPTTPLIFILSQGADPYEDWKKFAESQQMSKKLFDISLGQGQGPRAERMLQEGMESGAWVLLQNCHLATSWMPTLERLVENMSVGMHPNFRLWLTSMPSPSFPVSVLQNGVKMTNEPPKGMQANVTRSVLSYGNDFLDTCKKPAAMKKLFFAMCFFHALVQERRRFGPLGWNIAYEYTAGDLNCCVTQIKMFLDKYDNIPYKVIRELSGNIHYGGRVTDDWDRRTLNTLLETFVQPAVMDDGYRFSVLDTYVSVPATTQQGYLEYVASWPINTHPEAFGFHENADITCARTETFETLAAIVLLQGEASSETGSGKSPDEVVVELAQRIQQKIAAPFDLDKFRKTYPTRYEDSMNTVVVQEAIRFNRLVEVIHQSLGDLPLAIKGEVVMSKELEEMYKSIYNNQVPAQWAECAYPSLKPLAAWVDDLVLRLAMVQRWYDQGHPKAYWISGFFFPQAFLTGILQNYARKMQISIDTISYDFEWRDLDPTTLTSAPETGCYIYGMFIEGARIDHATMRLSESKPKVLFEPTPVLWLKPAINRNKPISGVYECPLYKTVRRAGTLSTTGHSTNYVLTAEIATEQEAKHWIRRGVAMVCALST